MLKIITSLSFLYALTIVLLLIYGVLYYRGFVRSARHRRHFPVVFFIIGAACLAFLWINIHAPLRLKTFSNLDHHFIRHDGFAVNGNIELGRSDTVNFSNNSYNSFVFAKKDSQITVNSGYSEDPFYSSAEGKFRILSTVFPAAGHTLSFRYDSVLVTVKAGDDNSFDLSVNGKSFAVQKQIKKGISLWNNFKEGDSFINSSYYNNEKLANCLRNILLVRDEVSKKESGELKYFISGRVFRYVKAINYDQRSLQLKDLQFNSAIPDKNTFAWGIGFLDNNKNQFRLRNGNKDSFALMNRYPLSYPLTEESNNKGEGYAISKFLLSDSRDMLNMAPVFREGFLFSAMDEDSLADFSPVLLTYTKAAENKSLELKAQWLNRPASFIDINNDKLILPSRSSGFNWVFTIQNTFAWEFGSGTMSPAMWKSLLFGCVLLFFLLVFLTSLVKPVDKLSWVWQILSCVTIVLLTTRLFLYWRYKSFPPYEGMDLPSQQQLYSFWNFGIIIFAAVILAVIFGYGFIKYAGSFIRNQYLALTKKQWKNNHKTSPDAQEKFNKYFPALKRYGGKKIFFISWLFILIAGAGYAFAKNFDPGACRHLAIALTIIYFIYLYISYKHSPLVVAAERSWWKIRTGGKLDIIINNPVKILLSISLLAVFVFVDIGFAIVFLNFLLFNEAFLCINYAMAGLSTGSRRNATLFGALGFVYLLSFVLNLLYAPYIFQYLLDLPQTLYFAGYVFFSILIAYNLVRLLPHFTFRKRMLAGSAITLSLFVVAFFFFPKEKILDKAAMTKYRINVLTMPVEKAIEMAYQEGKTYEPVIRAAQNQWFINTLVYGKNNPGAESTGFNLLPHAPQNKGAKYNAQATDLVASRFFLAEHGRWSVLLYVLLLLLPTTLLASFYRLYPDFTNRINTGYPVITAGFSILNYFLVTALLVILAATGRYIFFGQDLPFGSILSKQSILFPSILIIAAVLLFRNIPLEYYGNRKKVIPGAIVFSLLAVLLFFVQPVFNKNKEFNAEGLATDMDAFVQIRLQPVLDHFDTSKATRRLSMAKKDQLFADSVRKMIAAGSFEGGNKFFNREIETYTRLGFSQHLDQSRLLYLDLYSGSPQLAVNNNYFRIEPPPHLQQSWAGNVFGDSSIYNISLWDSKTRTVTRTRVTGFTNEPVSALTKALSLSFRSPDASGMYKDLYLFNSSRTVLNCKYDQQEAELNPGDSLKLFNPWRIVITDSTADHEMLVSVEPDAFMKNYYVNGNRYYVYPMGNRFIWARNFAESIASEYSDTAKNNSNAFVSLDFELMDSLSYKIQSMMTGDTAYKNGAEYGICIADGNGRLIVMADFIKGLSRPDPNNKASFNKMLMGENGFISQSVLRKQAGNINLLRMNPGPGSTFKPIVFSAIASQLGLDWDAFETEGFSQPQKYFGGERVAEYDFEKNNGRIKNVADYLKYSDNYYHSDILLLGSYPKQGLDHLLKNFAQRNPDSALHWPYFSYRGTSYWLNGFENWPGYMNGKVNFGMDSSFTSVGLLNNYGIYTHAAGKSYDMFGSRYDSSLFLNAYKRSGFILPEYGLFDQQGALVDKRIPYDVFASCFRGHVKGSSQVMVAPAKMVEAYGKMVTQSRNYSLTLNPYATGNRFLPFAIDNTIVYNNYLSLMRENVFTGMKEVLYTGTASALGTLLKKESRWHYYAKTGTTGDNEAKTKSKLLAIVISKKDITDPDFNFRNNKFYTVYFTSQNGPIKQNEAFQNAIIQYIQKSLSFNRYMNR